MFDTFDTHSGRVYDVADTVCRAQNGSTYGRNFETVGRRFLTIRTTNQLKNCCIWHLFSLCLLSLCLSIYLPICLSVCLSSCPSVMPFPLNVRVMLWTGSLNTSGIRKSPDCLLVATSHAAFDSPFHWSKLPSVITTTESCCHERLYHSCATEPFRKFH